MNSPFSKNGSKSSPKSLHGSSCSGGHSVNVPSSKLGIVPGSAGGGKAPLHGS